MRVLLGFELSILKNLHRAGSAALYAAGFRWELRRSGEQKIGLWRKNWRKGLVKNPRRLVVIPGFGDTPLSWLPVLGLLRPVTRRNYDELVIFDFPGFAGFLSEHPAFPSMDMLLESTFDALDSLRPDTVLGHSLGGWLASSYAIACGKEKRPTRTSRRAYSGPKTLVLVDPGGTFEDSTKREEWEHLFRSAMHLGFEAIRPHVFGREPFWFKFLGSEFARFIGQREIFDFMNSVQDVHLVENDLHEIKCKTWVLWGEHDSMMPASCAPVWVNKINRDQTEDSPLARGVIIRGSGHSPQLEAPARTAAILGQILAGQEPHAWGARWWKPVE
jgi:pimeloyl-ACP methyl ester carboxylesterase